MKTPNHSTASESTPALDIGDVIDLVDMTRHLTEALFMATSDGGLSKHATNALQALIDVIDKNLVEISDRLETVSEAAEFHQKALQAVTKVIDVDQMMSAVRAEIARRKQLPGDAA